MKEHHVEKAFREHAENRGCTAFELSRKDYPDLGPIHKATTGLEDLEIEGHYTWCDREFQFKGLLHTDGATGWVIVQAYTRRALNVKDLPVAASLGERFAGFGLIIQESSIPGRENDGYFFWGICARRADFRFTEDDVNVISASLDATLTNFEEEQGIGEQ